MGDTAISWTQALVARFWSNVDKSGDCWVWTAGRFRGGYGQFRAGKRKVKAHRVSYELSVGRIPTGMLICHRCDNPPCVNPSHLFVGTHADNSQDRENKGRGGRCLPEPMPGESNPAAKLTPDDVRAIRQAATAREPQRAIAARFGVSQSQIGNIVRGASWRING